MKIERNQSSTSGVEDSTCVEVCEDRRILKNVPGPAQLPRYTILNEMALSRLLGLVLLLNVTAGAELPSAKVIERYRQMLSINPVEGTALDRIWKAYSEAGKSAELIDQYRKEGTFPSEMVLGHLLRRAGQENEARAAYERATKLQPSSALPFLSLGQLQKAVGRHREAAENFLKASALFPQDSPQLTDVLFEAGQAWIAAGDLMKGADAWERAVSRAPTNSEFRRRLADSYVANELPDRALPHLEYLVGHAPPNERAQALQQLARVQQTMGNMDAAIQALEKAIALTTPGNWLRAELQAQLIRLHQRAHRVAELEDRWKRYAAENPRDLGGYLQLIALYERLGNLEQERTWLEKLVALAPKNPGYRLNLARLYVRLDQLSDAKKLYDQLLTELPSNSDLVFERARLDLLLVAPDMAKRRITEYLERSKNEEGVRSKALQFFYEYRLWDAVEEHLTANASRGDEESIIDLAEFLFAQGRGEEAENQLRRLSRANAPPEEQARGWLRIAQTLKAQGRFGSSNKAVQQALAHLNSQSAQRREALLLAGELRSAFGEPEAAKSVLAEAVALSRTPAEQVDAEQKLFDCLRQLDPQQTDASGRPGEFVLPPPEGGVASAEEPQPAPLAEYLATLRREAETQNTSAAWLRLARWRMWCRDATAALDAANKAISAEPQSVAAHEFIVKLSSSAPTSISSQWHLGKLAEVDPANRVQYQRRIAQLSIQTGNITEGLRTLEGLAKEQPGNVDVLTDLATAQQRAERWNDALVSWQKVLAASPASRRGEAIAPLLRIYERLRQPQKAAELLLKEVENRSDPKEQLDQFTELRDFCMKNQLLPWLRTEWEKRKKRLGDDYVTDVALGRILKAQGEKAAGFQLLVDASLSAPDPTVALPELVREAEESHKLDDAVRLQERLVRSVSTIHFGAWLKLAELQEKTFAFEESRRTWTRIAGRFPWDAAALLQASEFWQREGDSAKAIELLRRVRTLEPNNARALLSLAQLALESGNFDEAHECLEEVLRHTPPQKLSEPLRLPGVRVEESSRLQSAYLATVRSRGGQPSAEAMRDLRNFWSETAIDTKGNEKDLRLSAIRELARIIVATGDTRSLEKWVARWRNNTDSSPGEAIWALFYANAGDPALDLVEEEMRREPANVQNKQAFIWLALQTGQKTRLASWLRAPERTNNERDFLMIALGQHLDAQGTIDPEILKELFPPTGTARLWQVAAMFASRMRFSEAARLGDQAFVAAGTERDGMGLELAHWHLFAGDVAGACRILRQQSAEPADSFESASCAAMRELYFLLPANERVSFVERSLEKLKETEPVHAAVFNVLLNGLNGNEGAARAGLDRLLDMRVLATPVPDETSSSISRQWTFYLSAGLHLQAWKLGDLAAYVWEKALADPAFVRLEGEQASEISREMRTKLAALRLARMSPQDAAATLSPVLNSMPPDDTVTVGEALESLGALPQAIALYRNLWEREPSDPQPLRNLLNACRMADDMDTAEEVLRKCISDRTFPNDTLQRDFAGQLADILERKDDIRGAIKIMSDAVTSVAQDPRLLQRLAQLQEKAGNIQEAASTWRQLLALESGHTIGKAALARLLEKQGDIAGALSILDRSNSTETDAQLPTLLLKNDQVSEAFDALQRISPAKLPAAAQNLAQELISQDQVALARSALQEALEHISDPNVTFQLRARLLETFSPPTDRAIILHELRSIRRFVRTNPALTGDYLAWLQQKAHTLAAEDFAREEFINAWADGAGLLSAGRALVGWHLKAQDYPRMSVALTQLLKRPDATAQQIESVLSEVEQAAPVEYTAQIHEQLTRLNPQEDQRIIDWARAIAKAGDRGTALTVLDRWGARAWLADESAGRLAQAYVELGATGKADALFAHAIAQDLPKRNFRTFIDYARLQRERGNLPKAQYLLTAAFRQPACREYSEIIAWMSAANQLGQLECVLPNFELSPSRATPLRQALFEFYQTQGKSSEALQLISDNPEIVTPAILCKLRPLANRSGDYAPCAETLEKHIKEVGGDESNVSNTLALLYSDWADASVRNGNEREALIYLQSALRVRSDLFSVTKRLAAYHERHGAMANAIQVLEQFMKQSKDLDERRQASKILEKLRVR